MAKFCRYCGSPVREGANFCKNCGHALTKSNSQPNAAEKSAKTSAVQLQNVGTMSNSVENAERNIQHVQKTGSKRSAPKQTAPGKKRKSSSVASLINVLLFILCLVLVFMGLRTIPENIRDARVPVQPFGELDYDEEVLADFAAAAEISEDDDDDFSQLHDNYSWLYGTE